MTNYEAIIGFETHIQLNTQSNILCACRADSWGAEPNTNIFPVCTGLRGVLPVGADPAGIHMQSIPGGLDAQVLPIRTQVPGPGLSMGRLLRVWRAHEAGTAAEPRREIVPHVLRGIAT